MRYTDDFVLLGEDPVTLTALLPAMRTFLHERLVLELHDRKTVLQKLRQGIDFLGYVALPHYRILRTNTKRRMRKALWQWDRNDFSMVESYRGILKHCNAYALDKELREFTNYDECWKYGVMFPW